MQKNSQLSMLLSFFLLLGLVGIALVPVASPAQAPLGTPFTAQSFKFTAIEFPGGSRTRTNGLNDFGDLVGDYFDSSRVRHGYLLRRGEFTTFDPPGSIETRGLVINNLRVIGGRFTDGNSVAHGFLLKDGVLTNR